MPHLGQIREERSSEGYRGGSALLSNLGACVFRLHALVQPKYERAERRAKMTTFFFDGAEPM